MRVREFAHVARPVVAQQRALRPRASIRSRARENAVRERQHVVAAIGERWHLQLDHVEPVVEVFAESALPDRLERASVLVAEMMRTLTRRVWLEPSRSNSPVCSTRSSFAWPAIDRLPISSRNSVPPLAASKRPSAALGAGERAGLGAEQFALEQLGRQRADD